MKKKPPEKAARQRTAILVLGMHRSGTSALARTVNLLGATAPRTLMPADPTNPRGFWESNQLVPIDEAILAAAGSAWDGWRSVEPAWSGYGDASVLVARLKETLVEEFSDAQLFVVKDPRLCRLLPIWLDVLGGMNVAAVALHIIRNPLEVAASLQTRNGFPLEKSMLIWLRHVLDAEAESRTLPRAFLCYEKLVTDWRSQLETVERTIGIRWPSNSAATQSEINQFLTPDLRRNRATDAELNAHTGVVSWVKEAYAQLQTLMADPADTAALSSLDRIKAAFDTACAGFVAAAAPQTHEIKERDQRLAIAADRISNVETALRQKARELERATGDVVTAQARAREREQAVEREAARAETLAKRAQTAEAQAAQIQMRLDSASNRIGELESSLAGAQDLDRQLKQQQSEAQRLEIKLTEATKQQARSKTDLLESERARAQAVAELERSRLRSVEQEGALARADAEAAALRSTVRQLQAHLDQLSETHASTQSERARNAAELESALSRARNLAATMEDKHAAVQSFELELRSLRSASSEYDAQIRKGERQIAEFKTALSRAGALLADAETRAKVAEAAGAHEKRERANAAASHATAETNARAAIERAERAEGRLRAASAKIAALNSRLNSWSGLMGSVMKRAGAVIPRRPSGSSTPSLQQQARIIAKAGLFDAAWYRAQHPDVGASGIEPLMHYLQFGWKEGRDPSSHFSTAKYLESNPNVRRAGVCPLYHYAVVGRLERRSPQGGSVEPAASDAEHLVAEEFDGAFYAAKYAGALRGQEPLKHFLQFGWRNGFDPHEHFSVADYLKSNPDVRAAGVNPFVHYLLAGRREGRVPRGAPHHSADYLEQRRIIAAEFDVAFYFASNPGVKAARLDPVEHFMQNGWSEGNDPAPGFSTRYYLAAQQDVREAGINPFYHFLVAGRAEGRQGRPSEQELRRGEVRDTLAAAFDSDFYLATNLDVAGAGVEPIDHYLDNGWSERRDPTPLFSTGFYLDANPDVAAAGVNPFYHYIVAGKAEGRKAMHPGGWRANALARLKPVAQQIEEAVNAAAPSRDLTFGDLAAKLDAAIGQSDKRLVVSIGHDDYTTSVGGIQLCLKLEEQFARDNGSLYLNLYPAVAMPFLSPERNPRAVAMTVVCNGEVWGTASAAAIGNCLRAARPQLAGCDLTVHSLLGHSPEAVADLQRALEPRRALFWVHDFFSICPSYTLLRNGISYCGAPQSSSPACSLCVFGEERQAHLRRFGALFGAVPFEVVAPSPFAAEFWQSHCDLPHKRIVVQPHCVIEPSGTCEPALEPDGDAVRVAFLGHPSPHKGWQAFVRVADAVAADARYEFHHFGSSRKCLRATKFTRVSVLEDGPNAMIEALRRNEIDAVVLWSVWPETFSFVAHEAIAAGALILTCEASGNIARVAREHDKGIVFGSEDELEAAFCSGRIRNAAVERRRASRALGEPRFSRMSFDLLGGALERVQ